MLRILEGDPFLVRRTLTSGSFPIQVREPHAPFDFGDFRGAECTAFRRVPNAHGVALMDRMSDHAMERYETSRDRTVYLWVWPSEVGWQTFNRVAIC